MRRESRIDDRRDERRDDERRDDRSSRNDRRDDSRRDERDRREDRSRDDRYRDESRDDGRRRDDRRDYKREERDRDSTRRDDRPKEREDDKRGELAQKRREDFAEAGEGPQAKKLKTEAAGEAAQSVQAPTDEKSLKLKMLSDLLAKQRKQLEATKESLEKQKQEKEAAREKSLALMKAETPVAVLSSVGDAKEQTLLLDDQGRQIDSYGNVISGPILQKHPTSLANKRRNDVAYQQLLVKKRRENPYVSSNTAAVINQRKKRTLDSWVEPGTYIDMGTEIRESIKQEEEIEKAYQFEKKLILDEKEKEEKAKQDEEDAIERMNEEKRAMIGAAPKDVEWWDKPFLLARKDPHGDDIFSYGALIDPVPVNTASIDNKIIHPVPIQPPAEIQPDGPVPLPITKKEQAKITKQNKLAARIRRNEEQLLGIREAPKDRVRLTNMYRVYGAEAMMDPTKIELKVRQETAEREERHHDRNQERKLTPEQRREKKMKKLTENTDVIVNVCVFKVLEMSSKNKAKIEKNAQQLFMTGTCVITPSMSVIAVEGSVLAVRRYKKLMGRRIKWNNERESDSDEESSEEEMPEDNKEDVKKEEVKESLAELGLNRCDLIWEGEIMTRNFNDFQVKASRTEAAAKKYLSDRGVLHYYEMARTFAPGK